MHSSNSSSAIAPRSERRVAVGEEAVLGVVGRRDRGRPRDGGFAIVVCVVAVVFDDDRVADDGIEAAGQVVGVGQGT